MKTYVKPGAKLVNVRLEERLALVCPETYDPDQDPIGYEPATPDEVTTGCSGIVYYTLES